MPERESTLDRVLRVHAQYQEGQQQLIEMGLYEPGQEVIFIGPGDPWNGPGASAVGRKFKITQTLGTESHWDYIAEEALYGGDPVYISHQEIRADSGLLPEGSHVQLKRVPQYSNVLDQFVGARGVIRQVHPISAYGDYTVYVTQTNTGEPVGETGVNIDVHKEEVEPVHGGA